LFATEICFVSARGDNSNFVSWSAIRTNTISHYFSRCVVSWKSDDIATGMRIGTAQVETFQRCAVITAT